MALHDIFQAIEDTAAATAIRESGWLFPTIETIHVLALVSVVGAIAMLDLRLLGYQFKGSAITAWSEKVLPWTWVAFGFAVLSGGLLFISSATRYYINLPFQLKIGLIVLAGLNMLLFHFGEYRNVGQWDHTQAPARARVAAALSLTFWALVVVFGRWIGFTLR